MLSEDIPQWTCWERLTTYYRVWRGRGAATLDHHLWAYWAIFGRYPRDRKHKEAGE